MNTSKKSTTIIFGIDILSYMDESKKRSPVFSLVVLADGRLDKYQKVSFRRLLRKIWDIKPEYIAIDNLFEIAHNNKAIISFLARLPDTTSLIQVTGNPRISMEKITVLIKKYLVNSSKTDLSFNPASKKLNALETAEVCAILCRQGIGYEVIAFEDEIKIKVSKKKSHGHGGWSAPRFERISKAAVNSAGKDLEETLKKFNLSYEEFSYPNRRNFIITIPPESINKIRTKINELKTDLVDLKLQRIQKSSLEFRPLDLNISTRVGPRKNIILGIDPGTTTGIAILDFRGKVLYINSIRECGLSQLIRLTSEFGNISIVAADVNPVPAKVEKVGKLTGSKIVYPPSVISSSTKREYVRNYDDLTINFGRLNSHESDALFAALRAFNGLKSQLERIDTRILEEAPHLKKQLPEIQRKVILGNSLTTVIESFREEGVRNDSSHQNIDLKQVYKSLRNEIESIQTKNDILSEEIELLEKETLFWRKKSIEETEKSKQAYNKLEKLRLSIADKVRKRANKVIRRENERILIESQDLRQKNRNLKSDNIKLKQIESFWVQGTEIPLKPIYQFNEISIKETEYNYGINIGDIVIVLDPSGGGARTARFLIEKGIRGIICSKSSPHFSDQAKREFNYGCVPILRLNTVDFIDRDKFIPKDELKILVFEDLWLIDIAVKVEVEKQELLLKKKLRRERHQKLLKSLDLKKTEEDLSLEVILEDFKQEYIKTYKSLYEEENNINLDDEEEKE